MRVASSTMRSTAGRVKRVPVSSLHYLARACDETLDICTSLGAATTALTATTSIPKSVSDARASFVAFLRGVLSVVLTFAAQVLAFVMRSERPQRRREGASAPPPRRRRDASKK